jgi:hypothetical protein
MSFISAGSAVQQWKGGLLKMIAVRGENASRSAGMTVAETVPV